MKLILSSAPSLLRQMQQRNPFPERANRLILVLSVTAALHLVCTYGPMIATSIYHSVRDYHAHQSELLYARRMDKADCESKGFRNEWTAFATTGTIHGPTHCVWRDNCQLHPNADLFPWGISFVISVLFSTLTAHIIWLAKHHTFTVLLIVAFFSALYATTPLGALQTTIPALILFRLGFCVWDGN